jgi:transketolase
MNSHPVPEALANVDHNNLANAIRALSMDAVQQANSGHPGMPMGMADVATVLFTRFLKYSAANPNWPDRDRFVLSAGHGSMLLYAVLHLTGNPDISMAEIQNFRQLGAKTAGHPEYGHAQGIETTTGPLGQGIANAVGMALAERILATRFGDDFFDHHTYAIAGDGCLMEGISHEAISLAGHLRLGKLVVLFDDNGITIDGPTDLSVSDDQCARFAASGWHVARCDGHDSEAIAAAIEAAKQSDKPSLVACKTEIGFGAPNKAGTSGAHGAPLGVEEIAGARANLDWPSAPFEIPDDILAAWRAAGAIGNAGEVDWNERLGKAEDDVREAVSVALSGDIEDAVTTAFDDYRKKLAEEKPTKATRQSSGDTIAAIAEMMPQLIGGSADLTGSNLTKAGVQGPITADDFSGAYLYYGVREHAMAAVMNGMALHGGVIPYGGTFMVFTDYCRPAIRLSALMGIRVVYVMTHDSIGLGEDGPTHQPVEHMAALRAIPNLNVMRPADAMETAECWQAALENETTPSILALSRQGLPALRLEHSAENHSAKGAYELLAADGEAQVTLIASGSEVSLAVTARNQLQSSGIPTRVVSMPSWLMFDRQEASYRQDVLQKDTLRVAIEAATGMGWERYIGDEGIFIGMDGFGASAPAKDLYHHFGITAEAVVEAVKAKLN